MPCLLERKPPRKTRLPEYSATDSGRNDGVESTGTRSTVCPT